MRLVIDMQGAQGSSHTRGIGRYSRELALAMARSPRGHQVIIALSSVMPNTAEDLIRHFCQILPRDQIRVWHPPENISYLSQSNLRAHAERLRITFLASLQPDLVHVTSLFEGLGDDIVTSAPASYERLPTVATCYDLIPLLRHQDYFSSASGMSQGKQWYFQKLQEMAMCDGLLAISDSSRNEAISHLGFAQDRIYNVGAGIHEDFRPVSHTAAARAAMLQAYGISKEFILFVGAGDLRKNEARLIEAYARLDPMLRSRFQLTIVGRTDSAALRRIAAELQITEEQLVLVPFVKEGQLPALYSNCSLFVFPSLHEGFGLPVGEAMACGAAVIASNTSSLPEVAGRDDVLFDPYDVGAIAATMQRVLTNSDFRRELMRWGPVRAAQLTWPNSAKKAWDALEELEKKLAASRPCGVRAGAIRRRKRLAFVSPFPPQASGISEYSAELVPALARHYDITLVSDQPIEADPLLEAAFPRLDSASFAQVAAEYDRVVYQIGNSSFHQFQIEKLLPAVPGLVVLHDIYLSDYYNWLAHMSGDPDRFRIALYQSHGYQALLHDAAQGRVSSLRQFPCTQPVLARASGVVVHSDHAKTLVTRYFGKEIGAGLRVVPHARRIRPLPTRSAARQMLGLSPDDFVLCSFGLVTDKKRPMDVFRGWCAAGAPGMLVFVGDASPVSWFESVVEAFPGVRITGRIDRESYDAWLATADLAVQLRSESRGETSGAMADCLAAGLPLIVNRHGSAAGLPKDVCVILSEEALDDELGEAIASLHRNGLQRQALSQAAAAYARSCLDPASVARQYEILIENFYEDEAVFALAQESEDRDGAVPIVRSIARTFPKPRRSRLMMDISELARRDGRSGIQRVVREIMRRLLGDESREMRPEAVRVDQGRLRFTHMVPLRTLGLGPMEMPERPVDVRPGDILLCADVNAEITSAELQELSRLRLEGLRIVLMVYDVLPMRRPEWFPPVVIDLIRTWYCRMLEIAHQVICISRTCADELLCWLNEGGISRSDPLPINWFHLGSDFPADIRAEGESQAALVETENSKDPVFLAVGTVEPRKGYQQILDAFEWLWSEGYQVRLVIVGKLGWQMEAFGSRLLASPHRGSRLFWLEHCDDRDLQGLYSSSSALVMASQHEGFGLPIVEAFRAGLPVIARDIPVFREVTGGNALFFKGDERASLSSAVLEWLALRKDGLAPQAGAALDWDESCRWLVDVVTAKKAHYTLWEAKPSP